MESRIVFFVAQMISTFDPRHIIDSNRIESVTKKPQEEVQAEEKSLRRVVLTTPPSTSGSLAKESPFRHEASAERDGVGTLEQTASWPALKIDGWKMKFPFLLSKWLYLSGGVR